MSTAPDNLFTITTTCPSIIKQLFTVLNTYLSETVIKITPEAIVINDVDSAGIVMIFVTLYSGGFNTYEYSNQEGIKVGVDLVVLNKFLKMFDSKGLLTFSMTDSSDLSSIQSLLSNQLIIQGTNTDNNKVTTVRLNTRDIKYTEYEEPSEVYDIIIDLETAMFKSIIDNLKKIDSDVVCITYTNHQLLFKTYNNNASYETFVTIDEQRITNNSGNDNIICETYLDIAKLSQVNKCSSLSSNVIISMTNSYPINLKYKIGDLGYISILISPSPRPKDWSL